MANLTNLNNKFLVTTGGNVGIGTTSPSTKLHIVGANGAVTPSGFSVFDLTVADNAESAIGILGNTYSSIYFGDAADPNMGAVVYNHSTNALDLRVNGNATAVTVNSDKTTTFAANIHTDVVNNKANSANIIYRSGTSTLVGGGTLANKLYVLDSGNVGIGTTNPLSKLTVSEGTDQHGIELAPGTLSYLQCYDRATSTYGNMTIDAKYLAFGLDNGAEKIRFTADGNVGIGTTSPGYPLDISKGTEIQARFVGSQTGHTQGAILLSSGTADTPSARGQGVYRFNEGNDETWYTGTAYSNTAKYIWARQGSTTSFASDTAQTTYALMTLQNTGNLGIGTTSPATKLQVANAGEVVVRSSMTAADGYRGGFEADNQHTGGTIWSMFSTNNSDGYFGGGKFVIANETMGDVDVNTPSKFVIDGAGSVLIGDGIPSGTPEADYRSLEIGRQGNTITGAPWKSNLYLTCNATITGGSSAFTYRYASEAPARMDLEDGIIRFYNAAAGTAGNTISWSEKMRIAADGNVGIGTTSPEGRLMVETTGADATPPIKINRGRDGGRIQMQYSGNENGYGEIGQMYAGTGRTTIWIGANLNSFATGHSSAPVQDDANYASWFSTWDSYNDRFTVNRISSGSTSQIFTINSSGNVGIGSTSPAGILTINGTGDAIRVESTNAGAGGAQLDLLHFTASPADEDTFAAINMGGYYTGTTSVYGAQVKSIWTDVSERHSRLEFTTCDTSLNTVLTLAHNLKATFTGDLQAPRIGIGAVNASFNLYNNGTSYFNGETTIDANLIMSQSNAEINFTSGNGVIQTTTASTSLTFGVNGSEKMRIHSTGDVLIGATDPTSYNSNADDLIIYEANDFSGMTLAADNDQGSNIYFADPDDDNVGGITYNHTSNYMNFRVNGSERMRIDSSGNVSLATATSLDFNVADFAQIKFKESGAITIDSDNDQSSRNFQFKDGDGSSLMFIGDDGKVGIGTTSPSSYNSRGRNLVISGAGDVGISIDCSSANSGSIVFADGTGGTAGYRGVIEYDHADDSMAFNTAATVHAKINSSGTLTVAGDLVAYGSPSDKRLKENIKPIESALDKVSKLQGVTFNWKESGSILELKEDVGFIAQDVQKVIPELVRENKDGMLSMRHQGIAPILLEAIKELKAEIEELKKHSCDCKK
jgi:hypothetical protein